MIRVTSLPLHFHLLRVSLPLEKVLDHPALDPSVKNGLDDELLRSLTLHLLNFRHHKSQRKISLKSKLELELGAPEAAVLFLLMLIDADVLLPALLLLKNKKMRRGVFLFFLFLALITQQQEKRHDEE